MFIQKTGGKAYPVRIKLISWVFQSTQCTSPSCAFSTCVKELCKIRKPQTTYSGLNYKCFVAVVNKTRQQIQGWDHVKNWNEFTNIQNSTH